MTESSSQGDTMTETTGSAMTDTARMAREDTAALCMDDECPRTIEGFCRHDDTTPTVRQGDTMTEPVQTILHMRADEVRHGDVLVTAAGDSPLVVDVVRVGSHNVRIDFEGGGSTSHYGGHPVTVRRVSEAPALHAELAARTAASWALGILGKPGHREASTAVEAVDRVLTNLRVLRSPAVDLPGFRALVLAVVVQAITPAEAPAGPRVERVRTDELAAGDVIVHSDGRRTRVAVGPERLPATSDVPIAYRYRQLKVRPDDGRLQLTRVCWSVDSFWDRIVTDQG